MYRLDEGDWPAGYRRLGYVLAGAAVCLALFGWFRILPRWTRYTGLRDGVRRMEQERRSAAGGWSDDPRVLQACLERHLRWIEGPAERRPGEFRGMRLEERRLRARATGYLKQRIVRNYPAIARENDWMAIESFVRTSSRIEFKYLANQLEAEFAGNGLRLPENVGQIAEARPEPVYQRILQLWTVEFLFRGLQANHLRIETDQGTGAAAVTLLPPVGFVLGKDDPAPFLWEFPVRIRVRGTLQDFFRLLETLVSRKFFFPVRNLSVRTSPPSRLPRKEDLVEIKEQTIEFTASSFFLPPSLGDAPADAAAAAGRNAAPRDDPPPPRPGS